MNFVIGTNPIIEIFIVGNDQIIVNTIADKRPFTVDNVKVS